MTESCHLLPGNRYSTPRRMIWALTLVGIGPVATSAAGMSPAATCTATTRRTSPAAQVCLLNSRPPFVREGFEGLVQSSLIEAINTAACEHEPRCAAWSFVWSSSYVGVAPCSDGKPLRGRYCTLKDELADIHASAGTTCAFFSRIEAVSTYITASV